VEVAASSTNVALGTSPSATLVTACMEQARWSVAAHRAKNSYLRWSGASLAIVTGAAFAGTAANEFPAGSGVFRLLSFASALLVGVLAVIGQFLTSPGRMRSWIRARSASEGLKSEVYLYLMRAGPYRRGDARRTLANRLGDIEVAVGDIVSMVAGIAGSAGPAQADTMTHEQYLTQRVKLQIGTYYEPRAASERRLVSRYRAVELALAILGAVLGALAGFSGHASVSRWASVVTTALAAVAAHLAAARHEYQVTTYTATALRLKQLRDRFEDSCSERGSATADEIDAFVTDCEAAISIENQGWMAQWTAAPRP
jgi:hypothetical protein